MQIISSLLRMQSRHIKDEELIKVFLDSQARIRTMALIHEKLYRSGNFSRIDLAEYIRDLAVNLYTSYGVKRERIGLKVQGEGIFLGIKEAIPCGLIVNELISNALKHAFPGKSKGEITIALEADNGRIKIAVKDNGVGLTADLDFRRTESLGLQLVMTLVEQLEGAIDLHREGGTEFVITFASEKQGKEGYLS
jgi:two-component sensor histidine kinase